MPWRGSIEIQSKALCVCVCVCVCGFDLKSSGIIKYVSKVDRSNATPGGQDQGHSCIVHWAWDQKQIMPSANKQTPFDCLAFQIAPFILHFAFEAASFSPAVPRNNESRTSRPTTIITRCWHPPRQQPSSFPLLPLFLLLPLLLLLLLMVMRPSSPCRCACRSTRRAGASVCVLGVR